MKRSAREPRRRWIVRSWLDAMAMSKPGPTDRSYEVLSLFRRGPIDGN